MATKFSQTALDTTDDLEDVLSTEDVNSFKKKSISGAMAYTFKSVFLFALGVVANAILAAKLSTVNFGVYGFVTQIIILLQFISDVGFGPALVQMKQEPKEEDYKTAFTIQQLLSWVIFTIAVVVSFIPWIDQRIGMDGRWLLLALGISFPLTSFKIIPAIKIERKLQFSKLVVPHIAEQVVYNVVLIWLVFQNQGLMAYTWAILARSVVGVGVMYFVKPWLPGFQLNPKSIKHILGTGLRFQASDMLARIKDNLSQIVIAGILPQAQYGYVTFAKQFSQMPYTFTVQNVLAITFPAFSWLQKDPKRLTRAIEKTLYFISLSIFPLLVGMSVFIYPLTVVIPQYAKWQPALPLFIMMTLSIGWGAVTTPLTNTLNAIGHINKTLQLMMMWTILTWVLMVPLTWFYGYNGMGVATVLINSSSILAFIFVKKYITVDIWGQLAHPFLASIAMGLVGLAGFSYWSQSLLLLLTGMVASGLTYWLVIGLIGRSKLLVEINGLRAKL